MLVNGGKVLKMHGRCNSCDNKIFMLSLNNGKRKTARYNDLSTATFYGQMGASLRFEHRSEWRWSESPCCGSLIRRSRSWGDEEVLQYVQC